MFNSNQGLWKNDNHKHYVVQNTISMLHSRGNIELLSMTLILRFSWMFPFWRVST